MILFLKFVWFAILKNVLMIFKKNRECKQCNIKRVLKQYYGKKVTYYKKRRDKYARLKDLDFRLQAIEGKVSKKASQKIDVL